MFGYITINKAELKFKEYDQYHAYYCGLCSVLNKKYGRVGQISLSYDMTFILILLSSLYEVEENNEQLRCLMHPLKKHMSIINEITEYVADMNILLSFYKAKDDWADEKKIGKYIYATMLEKIYETIQSKYPKKTRKIRQCLEEINKMEEQDTKDVDKIAGLFGEIMAEVFLYKEDEWKEELYEMGYFLGKFIYLLDAYEDIEKDVKKKNYNPYIDRLKEEKFSEEVEKILTMMMCQCSKNFEQLPIIQDVELLRNILYSGVWFHYDRVTIMRREKEGKK